MTTVPVVMGKSASAAGVLPDLRHLSSDTHAQWAAIVLGGIRHQQGMVGFNDVLSNEESEAIHAYVIKRANDPDNTALSVSRQ